MSGGNYEPLRYFGRITGPIPPELGDLGALDNLNLVGNQLSGELRFAGIDA